MGGFHWTLALVSALPAAALGSFLNALAHWLVGGPSLLKARSACPLCGATLAVRDLFPIFSYVGLRGRCRRCQGRINPLNLAAELAAAGLALLWLGGLGPSPQAAWGLGFSLLLLTLALADLWAGLVPDWLVWPALAVAGLGPFWGLGPEPEQAWLGGLLVGGGLWLVAWLYERLAGQEGLGLGDVKLGALLGLLLGWPGGGLAVVLAAALGLLAGLARLLGGGADWRQPLAFAPCLALAGVITLLLAALGWSGEVL